MTELNYLDITKASDGHIKVPSIGLTSPAITESIAKTALASFADGAGGFPFKSLVGYINPVQSGSGDPSPSNIRPITGWTGMNVVRTGKNLLKYPYNETTHTTNALVMTDNGDGTITVNGTPSATTYFNFHTAVVPIFLKAGAYKIPATGNSNIQFNWYYSDATALSTGNTERTFTLTQDSYVYCFLRFSSGVQFSNVTINPMLLLATETNLTYEPFGTTYPISWSDEAGTVYGGYLNPVTGVLTVTHELKAISEFSWTQHTTNTIVFYTTVSGKAFGVSNIMSDAFSVTGASVTSMTAGTMRGLANNAVVYIAANSTDPTDFTNDYGTNQLLYELATPVTYQLTPTEVLSVLGMNNVWVDTNGDVECTYIADTKLYIDSKL